MRILAKPVAWKKLEAVYPLVYGFIAFIVGCSGLYLVVWLFTAYWLNIALNSILAILAGGLVQFFL